MKSCISPTGPDHTKTRTERLLTWIIVTRLDQCPDTQSSCSIQTTSVFGNFGSLGGCTLGSTNVEGGLHSPFLVKTTLTRSPHIINCYVHSHRNLHWLEALHQLIDQHVVEPVQNLWSSSTKLSCFHNHTAVGDLFYI